MKISQENKQMSEKGYSTIDYLQALKQIIEKSNEYSLPLWIGFIDKEKVFDSRTLCHL